MHLEAPFLPSYGSTRIAIHDLGSHSFHLLCARIDAGGAVVRESSRKHLVRLGASSLKTGHIPADAWQRGLDALDDLATVARAFDGQTYAVGTSVLRDTHNGAAFAAAASDRLGIPVKVLAGSEEAELVFLGALSVLPPTTGTVAVIDLGGGSLEIAVGDRDGVRLARSLPLGTLRMRGLGSDGLAAYVRARGTATWSAVRALAPGAVVLTGGSARLLATLHGDSRLDCDGFAALERRLASLGDEARVMLGIPAERLDTVVPSAAILRAVISELGGVAWVSACGMREGFLVRASRTHGARNSRLA